MLEILKVHTDRIETLEKPQKDCWINVVQPNEADIQFLRTLLDIPEEVFAALRDREEIPSIEDYPNFTLIIIRSPYNVTTNSLAYVTHPLGILLSDQYVITICYFENDVLPKIKSLKFNFKKSQLALRLLMASAKLYLTYLKEINKKVYEIEDELEKSLKNKEILNFLELEKSLVYFSTSLRQNEVIVDKLSRNEKLTKHTENKKLIQDIIDENRQAIQMAEIYSAILSNTLDAFASIISNNLNIVMKTLTSLTIILSIPTIIASIYGMNIKLPFASTASAFGMLMTLTIFLSIGVALFFWKKKFF
jgi:magnesium transporter